MQLRNGEHGYGVVTKVLHWLTVAAIAGQFAVGWTMRADDAALKRQDARIDQLEELGKERAKRGPPRSTGTRVGSGRRPVHSRIRVGTSVISSAEGVPVSPAAPRA